MRSMEFSGRTVDEAIFHGLNEMGVTIDQVDIITVQSETKGIFGFGARNAIVRLVERETPVVPDFTAINEERREQREERRERRDRKDDRRGGKGDKRSDRRREPREEKEAEAAPVEEVPYSKELAQELDSARFLQELLGKMGVNGTVSAFENEEGIKLKIDSDTDGLLIGRRGETLDALQYIVSLYENKDRKENGYRPHLHRHRGLPGPPGGHPPSSRPSQRPEGGQVRPFLRHGAHEPLRAPGHPLRAPELPGRHHPQRRGRAQSPGHHHAGRVSMILRLFLFGQRGKRRPKKRNLRREVSSK